MKDQWSMNYYQKEAVKTAIYPDRHKMTYPALGLAGEAGEIANKVKKFIRDGYDVEQFEQKKIELAAEIGDVLWCLTALAQDLGLTLEMVATANLEKLADRKARGKLKGSGDYR